MLLAPRVLLEAVPNVSLGPQDEALDAVVSRVEKATSPGVRLLDTHSDPDHHRTVLTLAGAPAPLGRALSTLADALLEEASLKGHKGVHPRLGLLDVVPVVRLSQAREKDARSLATRVSEHLAHRSVPSFFYGRLASTAKRERLAHHRGLLRWPDGAGPLEALPDAGPPRYHPDLGATCIGIRNPLVAYNVLLDTSNMETGNTIASKIRARNGGLPGVQALAFRLATRQDRVQVSTNVTDIDATTLPDVYEEVRGHARDAGTSVLGGELVGLAPERSLGPDPSTMGLDRQPTSLEEHLAAAGFPSSVPT